MPLHSRDSIDLIYMSRKEGETGIAIMFVIQEHVDNIRNGKGRLITTASNTNAVKVKQKTSTTFRK